MTPELNAALRDWAREHGTRIDYVQLGERIAFLAEHLFNQYQPTANPQHQEFKYRLRDWVGSVSDVEDKKTLVELVSKIAFFGKHEFEALYRAAYNRVVVHWLIDVLDIKFDDPAIASKIQKALRRTWFTGLSDSMDLSGFYHVNNIQGIDWRPEWLGVRSRMKPAEFERYMNDRGLERIVILEDFVGSGTQMTEASELFRRISSKTEILLAPLLICPNGVPVGRGIAGCNPNISFEPVLAIPDSSFVFSAAQAKEFPFHARVRQLAIEVFSLVVGSGWSQNHGPFGFGNMGGTVVMYTNCPDTTLPLIHRTSDGPWHALFPRSSRIA